jgi:hypothetical protein
VLRRAHVITCVALLPLACSQPGIDLTLANDASVPLDSVVIHTTGFSYPIGDLVPGAMHKLKVNSTGESHIEVEHGLPGARRRLVLGVYFEERYRGSVTARIGRDTVLALTSRIR